MATNFELGQVLIRISVCRAGEVPKRRIIPRLLSMDRKWDLELEEFMALAPVDLCIEADRRARVFLHCGGQRADRDGNFDGTLVVLDSRLDRAAYGGAKTTHSVKIRTGRLGLLTRKRDPIRRS